LRDAELKARKKRVGIWKEKVAETAGKKSVLGKVGDVVGWLGGKVKNKVWRQEL
jgi:hypothetical protein